MARDGREKERERHLLGAVPVVFFPNELKFARHFRLICTPGCFIHFNDACAIMLTQTKRCCQVSKQQTLVYLLIYPICAQEKIDVTSTTRPWPLTPLSRVPAARRAQFLPYLPMYTGVV